MKRLFPSIWPISVFVVACIATGSPAAAQAVRRDTVPRAAQRPAVRTASVDSLVECSPVAAPAKKKPAVRRKPAPVRKGAAAIVKKPAHKVSVKPRGPIVHRARRVTPKAPTATPVQSTTVVMCRPVRPIAALARGTPTEESVVPVPTPQLATATPVPVAVADEEGPPIFVSTAPGFPLLASAGGTSWAPFAVIPAIFVPFIHSGRNHSGNAPVDTTTTPPIDTTGAPGTPVDTTTPPGTPVDTTTPPGTPVDTTTPPGTPVDTTTPPGTPVDTTPVQPPPDTTSIPPIGPPTTTPEPGSIVLLGSGLLGLGAVVSRKRKK